MTFLKSAGVDTRNLWWKYDEESSTLMVSDVEQGSRLAEALQKDEFNISLVQFEQPKPAVVVSPLVQMRAQPSHQSELLSQAALGEAMLVYDRLENWLHVQSVDGYVGWIWFENIQFETYFSNCMALQPLEYVYRDETFQKPLIPLFAGAKLFKSGLNFCTLPDGRQGFVKNDVLSQLSEKQNEVDVSLLISDAFRFSGLPYLWGGSRGTALDCSGFMQLIFGFQGITLPRDASQQALLCQEDHPYQYLFSGKIGNESTDYLAKGALLFFSTQNRVTHVGLSLGDGRFIHASDSVKVNSLLEADEAFAPERKETFSFAIHLA